MVAINHKFASAKGDGADPTRIQPSNWNDTHKFQGGANCVIGNATSSSGDLTEIPCTSFARSILAATSAADLLAIGISVPTTGDAQLTLKVTAPDGWLMMTDGTIGNALSGATFADASAQDLFELIWNNISNSWAPVVGGRGASASADWAAQKKLTLTKQLGRAILIGGAGSGLTSRALGETGGEETHQLTTDEAPTGQLTLNFNDPEHSHQLPLDFIGGGGGLLGGVDRTQPYGNGQPGTGGGIAPTTSPESTGITASLTDHAGDQAHNNMQPWSAWNVMIKL